MSFGHATRYQRQVPTDDAVSAVVPLGATWYTMWCLTYIICIYVYTYIYIYMHSTYTYVFYSMHRIMLTSIYIERESK